MFSFTTNVSGINLYKEIKAMRNKDEHTINLLQKKNGWSERWAIKKFRIEEEDVYGFPINISYRRTTEI